MALYAAIATIVVATTGTIVNTVQQKKQARKLAKQRREDIALEQGFERLGTVEASKDRAQREKELEFQKDQFAFDKQESAREWKWKEEDRQYQQGVESTQRLINMFSHNDEAKNNYINRLTAREAIKAAHKQKSLI